MTMNSFRLKTVRLRYAAQCLGLALLWPVIAISHENKGVVGLALEERSFAIYQSEDEKKDCPDGFVFSGEDNWRAQFPTKEEQAEHLKVCASPRNRGPNCEHEWNNPMMVTDMLPMRETKSTISFGRNLDGTVDGRATPSTCKHKKFRSPDGKVAVDNQFYRAVACAKNYRDTKDADGFVRGIRKIYQDAYQANSMIFEITDVDDLVNDDRVLVSTYKSTNRLLRNPAGSVIPWQSQNVDEDAPEYKYSMAAKIIDGRLQTSPIDMKVPGKYFFKPMFELIYDMRLDVQITETGAEGVLTGYADIEQLWTTNLASGGGSGPTLYRTLYALADGKRDEAGACAALSIAYDVKLTKVFVTHAGGDDNEK